VIRFLAFAVLLLLVFLVLRAAVAGFLAGYGSTGRTGGTRRALRNDLVKDPVCETYVPRRGALARTAGSVTYYFCSAACAEKFKVPG
jgi:YHS domain-containing protein